MLDEFIKKLAENQQDLDPKIIQAVNENIKKLLA